MVLTGKQALDYSGGVSAEDNFGIGGYDRIMGPNGQAPVLGADPGRAPADVLLAPLRPHLRRAGRALPAAGRHQPTPLDRDISQRRRTPLADSDFATRRRHLLGRRATPSARSRSTSASCCARVADADHPAAGALGRHGATPRPRWCWTRTSAAARSA